MPILLFFLTPLWILGIAKDALFWVYLWQLKEYRFDRMRSHFQLKSARNLLFNNKTRIVLLLFLFSLISVRFSSVGIVVGIGAVLFYVLQAYRIYTHVSEKQLKMPVFTAKAFLMLGLIGILYGAILVISWIASPARELSILLIADLLLPIPVIVFVAFLGPISSFLKRRSSRRAKRKRMDLPGLLVIGITGSYGKTSTKDFLFHILQEDFNVHKTPKNTNTEIGIAQDFLANVTKNHDIYIVEIGAYKIGEISSVCEIIHPNIGVITGISNQHGALFGSLENIRRAKYELIESLPEKGLAILNADNENCRGLLWSHHKPKRIYSSSISPKSRYSGIFATSIHYKSDGIILKVTDKKEDVRIEASLLGYANAINLLGAITVAHALGMKLDKIARRIKTIRPPSRTMEHRDGIKGARIIDDSYSGNYDGVLSALDTLKIVEGKKKICILHPIIELGNDAKNVHEKIGEKIGKTCDYCIVTAADFFPEIKSKALSAGMERDKIFMISDPYVATKKAQELIDEGDVVLLENRIPQGIRNGLIM